MRFFLMLYYIINYNDGCHFFENAKLHISFRIVGNELSTLGLKKTAKCCLSNYPKMITCSKDLSEPIGRKRGLPSKAEERDDNKKAEAL